jgi:hemerythrin-like domain-containing protein
MLRGHLAWEDAESPRLRAAHPGGEGAFWLHSTHDDLRTVLDFCRHSCGDENHPVPLAQRVRDLADFVRRSLGAEEQGAKGRGPMIGNASADCAAELLGVDHRRLDAALADAKRLLVAGEVAAARERFGVFREGLERHIEAEEQVLFPVFEELTGAANGGPTSVMRAEHTELRKLMAEVAGVLEMRVAEGLTTPLAALTARIYAHNGKEERILYPMTDRLARAAGTLDELLRRLREF